MLSLGIKEENYWFYIKLLSDEGMDAWVCPENVNGSKKILHICKS